MEKTPAPDSDPAPEGNDPATPSSGRVPPPEGGWLTRNLLVLCGVSFLQDAASELLYPIMPIFLTAVLGAPVAVVGAVEGAAEAVASVTKIVAGRFADRVQRRRMVGAGYGFAAVGKMIIAVAGSWPMVLAGRGVDRLGKGIRGAPRDSLLVQDVPPDARGRAFGLHRAADTSGAVVGPLLGLWAYEAFHHRIRPILAVAVVPAVLSVLLIAAVRERPRPPTTVPGRVAGTEAGPDVPLTSAPAGMALGPRYWRVVAILFAFSLANFPDALLLLRVRSLGFSVPAVILAYVAYNTSYALLSYPAGVLSDRWSPHRIYGVGLLSFAVCYIGLGVVHDGRWVWPLLVIYGGFTASTDGVGKAWISGLVDVDHQGRAQGTFQGMTGGAVLVAGLWAGLAWHGTGRIPLVASGVVAAVVATGLLTSGSRLDPVPRRG
jgi:MFS family permease